MSWEPYHAANRGLPLHEAWATLVVAEAQRSGLEVARWTVCRTSSIYGNGEHSLWLRCGTTEFTVTAHGTTLQLWSVYNTMGERTRLDYPLADPATVARLVQRAVQIAHSGEWAAYIGR